MPRNTVLAARQVRNAVLEEPEREDGQVTGLVAARSFPWADAVCTSEVHIDANTAERAVDDTSDTEEVQAPSTQATEAGFDFWGSSSVIASMVAVLVYWLGRVFPLAKDLVVFGLTVALLRMVLGWNLRKQALDTYKILAESWEEISKGKERYIHQISELLTAAYATNQELAARLPWDDEDPDAAASSRPAPITPLHPEAEASLQGGVR